MEIDEIEYRCTDEIVCPHCGVKESDSWEVVPGEEDIGNIDCGSCFKIFAVERVISITYNSYKIDWLKEWKEYNRKKAWNNKIYEMAKIYGGV